MILMSAAEKLTVKNEDGTYEQYGFNAQNWEYAVLTYVESLGLNFMNEDGTECEGYLNSPEVAEALDKYFAMAEEPNKVSPAASDLDTFGSATAMMGAGKLAMFVSGAWDKAAMDASGANYGMALIPEIIHPIYVQQVMQSVQTAKILKLHGKLLNS